MTREREHHDSLAQIFLRNGPDLLIVHITFDEIFTHRKFIAFDDVRFVAEIGTDHDGKGHILLLPMLQHSIPIHLRHEEIQEKEVGRISIDDIDGLLPLRRSTHTHTVLREDFLHHLEKECIILGHDDVLVLLARPEVCKTETHAVAGGCPALPSSMSLFTKNAFTLASFLHLSLVV